MAFGWFYTQEISQYASFKGANGGGDDFGLGTFIPAWFWAVVWAAACMLFMSKKIFGWKSWSGFFIVTFGAFPIADTVSAKLIRFDAPNIIAPGEAVLREIFFYMSFGGMLPEGRHPWASYHVCFFFSVWIAGFIGLLGSSVLPTINEAQARKILP